MASSIMFATVPQSVPQRISLVQATTEEETESDYIVTLRTPQERLLSPEVTETDYDSTDVSNTEGEMSSDSSDWDSLSDDMDNPDIGHSRRTSLASSYLPRNHKKQNPQNHISSLTTQVHFLPKISEEERDNNHNYNDSNTSVINNLDYSETLFYPYPNLQSLLFSQYHPYTINDYKIIDTNNNNNESSDDDDDDTDIISMNWYDKISVNKFKQLLSQLLITASFGIREDEIYLLFSAPTPQEIIQHLRFGVLTKLCNINIDRFGRRSFYYNYNYEINNNNNKRKSHFYNHNKLPSELDNLLHDDDNLATFIEETPSPVSIADINSYSPIVQSPIPIPKSPIDHDIALGIPLPMNNGSQSPINTSWDPIPIAKPLKITNDLKKTNNKFPVHLLTKKLPLLTNRLSGNGLISNINNNNTNLKLKLNLSNHSSNGKRDHNPYSNINFANTYLYTKTKKKTKINEYNANVPNIGSIIGKIGYNPKHKQKHNHSHKKSINSKFCKPKPIHIEIIDTPQFRRKFSKKKSPNRRPPKMPKPNVSERVKQKIKQRKDTAKTLRPYKKHHKFMTVNEFKSMSLGPIVDGLSTNNNYVIAKTISRYFDNIFIDTDTVVICSGPNKEASVSYWLKGNGEYVRRSTNIGIYNKTITIYRACRPIKPKLPIVSQKEFECFVRNVCEKNKNKNVAFIGDLLDKQFGLGVHFARSTLKRCDYDIFCRFSNKYECSFVMSSGAYIIAWRR